MPAPRPTAPRHRPALPRHAVRCLPLLALSAILLGVPGRLAAQPWTPLFDGRTLAGWQGHGTPGVVPEGWQVIDGAITRTGRGGDIETVADYENFELEFEWMVTPGGNSGVFYRIDPTVEVTYMSAPEYQVLDDALHADGKSRLTAAGAAYGLYPSPAGHTEPVGEWNARPHRGGRRATCSTGSTARSRPGTRSGRTSGRRR